LAVVEVDQVSMKFKPGQPLARHVCDGARYDIMPEQGGEKSYEDLAESTRMGLQSEGIPVSGIETSLFPTGTSADAPFLLRGRIDDFDITWCATLVEGWQTIRWELYSLAQGRVVHNSTTRSEIYIKDIGDPGNLAIRGVNLAVEQSARTLAREPGFRAALQIAAAPSAPPVGSSPPAGGLTIAGLPLFALPFHQNGQAVQQGTVLLSAQGHGSGFFISRDGYILTNAHVVGSLQQIRVELANGASLVGQVVRRDRQRDVALVKVALDNAPALPLRRSLPVVVAYVYAVGAPLDAALSGTVTKGIVSAIRTESDGLRYIQADVDIQAGNSGGPLTDATGNVVGLAVLGIQSAGGGSIGLNFFVPIEDALAALGIAVR